MIALPVVLAVLGVFDPQTRVAEARAGELDVQVEWSDRVRQNHAANVIVELVNDGDTPIDALVAISPEYVDAFSLTSMAPSPHRAWAARVEDVPAGARRIVVIALQANRAGPQRGVVRVRTDAGAEERVEVSTFVFP